jgi:hypothetical protein
MNPWLSFAGSPESIRVFTGIILATPNTAYGLFTSVIKQRTSISQGSY